MLSLQYFSGYCLYSPKINIVHCMQWTSGALASAIDCMHYLSARFGSSSASYTLAKKKKKKKEEKEEKLMDILFFCCYRPVDLSVQLRS